MCGAKAWLKAMLDISGAAANDLPHGICIGYGLGICLGYGHEH